MLIVEVTVETETDVSSPKPLELTDELRSIVEGDLRAGKAIADEVAHELTRHFRAAVPQQTWLGLAAHQPQQYGVAALENRDTGEFIFGLGAAQTATVRSSRLRWKTLTSPGSPPRCRRDKVRVLPNRCWLTRSTCLMRMQ